MIDWKIVPFNHTGRWEKNISSIMDPQGKVTFPQFLMECVVFWRSKFLPHYANIRKQSGWSNAIQKDVRSLVQQTTNLCNYFPHPQDEPLVAVAFKNFFRTNRVVAIGGYKKNRITKDGKIAISQAEKDVVLGVSVELTRLLKQRDSFILATPLHKGDIVVVEAPKMQGKKSVDKKGSLAALLKLEENIKNKNILGLE